MAKHTAPKVVRRGADAAVASAMSVILLVGVTVGVVAVTSVQLSDVPQSEAIDRLALDAAIGQGEDLVTLLHEGGPALDLGDVTLVIAVDDEPVSRGPAGLPGTLWEPGAPLSVPLPAGLPPGSRTDLTLVDLHGTTIATASVRTPAPLVPLSAPAGFALDATLAGVSDLTELTPGTEFRLDATVSHPEGRKFLRYVYADLRGLGGAVWLDLHDDGTNGDRVASDGVYGVLTAVPIGAPADVATISIVAVDLNGAQVRFDIGLALPRPPTGCFNIRPDGGVEPLHPTPLGVEVVGVDITYGADGPRIPVHASITLDRGATVEPLYSGAEVARGMRQDFDVGPGDIIGVRGQADYGSFHSTRSSWVAAPQVEVLRDGDLPPDVPAFGTIQTDIAVYLAPYVENGRISLASNEALVLIEFVTDIDSSAADFQDLVVLFDFECPHALSPGGAGPIALAGNPTCAELPGAVGWREFKLDTVANGVHTVGSTSVTITNYNGKSFDWSSNTGMDAVFVKGGSGGSHMYTYEPESFRASALTTPGIAGNGISHLSFCYD